MSRSSRERRLEAEDRWPLLTKWLVDYFGHGVSNRFETLPDAKLAAVSNAGLSDQKLLAIEWWDWNACFGTRSNLADYLDAYGVDLDFESDSEVRQFMNDIYDRLIVAIREVETGWKP